MSRARSKRQAALAPIAEDEPVAEEQPGPVAEIMALIDGLDAAGGCPASRRPGGSRAQRPTAPSLPPCAVEERVASLMSAAEDAVLQLKNECKRLLVLLPAKVRQAAAWLAHAWLAASKLAGAPGPAYHLFGFPVSELSTCCDAPNSARLVPPIPHSQTRKMQLADFQKAFPGDLQEGALEEIRERCAAMAAAAAEKAVPATGRGGRTAAKRGAEPETVLRTVRARRGLVAPPPKFSEAPPAAAEAETGSRRSTRSRLGGGAAAEPAAAAEQQQQPPGAWACALAAGGDLQGCCALPLECGLNRISPCLLPYVLLQRWPLGGAVRLLPLRLQPLACLAGCRCRRPCRLLARRWRCPSPCSHKSVAAAPRRCLCRTQPL